MAMRHTIKYNGVECQVCVCVLFPRTQRNERTEDHYQECGGWAGSLNCLPKKKKIEHGTHWVGCNIIYIHIAWCEHLAAHLNTKPHTQSLSWMECARTRTAQAQLHVIFFYCYLDCTISHDTLVCPMWCGGEWSWSCELIYIKKRNADDVYSTHNVHTISEMWLKKKCDLYAECIKERWCVWTS